MIWLSRFYSRRIVNVNVNIITAGIFALIFTVGVMHVLERTGSLHTLTGWFPGFTLDLFGKHWEFHGEKLGISALTFLVDIVADVAVYYLLHWLANHRPRTTPRPISHAYDGLSFIKDASLIQFERSVLSPLLYLIALGTQNRLLHQGVGITPATSLGFAIGIGVTRIIHTWWMWRNEQKAKARKAAKA